MDLSLETRLNEAVAKIEETGKKYAKARGLSWQMQEMKKVILSQIMKDMDGSIADREMRARCDQRYIDHLEGTGVAIAEENRTRAIYERFKAQFEAVRSLVSLEKAKINLT